MTSLLERYASKIKGVLSCFEALDVYNRTGSAPVGPLLIGLIGLMLGTQCIFTGFVLVSIKSITRRVAQQAA